MEKEVTDISPKTEEVKCNHIYVAAKKEKVNHLCETEGVWNVGLKCTCSL